MYSEENFLKKKSKIFSYPFLKKSKNISKKLFKNWKKLAKTWGNIIRDDLVINAVSYLLH
jgi:hypothetical protein